MIQKAFPGLFFKLSLFFALSLLGALNSAFAQTNEIYQWQWLNPIPQGNNLESCCYGNGRFVAVGRLGTALHSLDGIKWAISSVGANDELISVAYGDGKFVALGGLGRTWLSVNGLEWSLGSYGSLPFLNQIRYLNGNFWAVGGQGSVVTSQDGLKWVQQNTGSAYLMDITYGNGKYVAVGWKGAILTSPDGITWSTRLSGTAEHLWCVSFGGTQFVAMGGGGTVLTSTDGTVWIQRNSPPIGTEQIIESTFVAGQFIATGRDGGIFTAPDGINWVKRASGTSQGLCGLAYGSNRFVIVGLNGVMLTALNISSWNSIKPTATTFALRGAVDTNQIKLVVGDGGVILRKTDATDWVRIEAGVSSQLNRCRFFNSTFWIVGENGVLLFSADGVAWSRRTVGQNQKDIAFGNEAIVTVGRSTDGANTIHTSYDAKTWTKTYSATGRGLSGIIYAKGLFVAVGSLGVILTSPDGVVWTPQASGVSENISEIAFGNGTFVAVGSKGRILTSSNTREWFVRKSGTLRDLLCISWTGRRFISFGADSYEQLCAVSSDGVSWTSSKFPSAWMVYGVAAVNDWVLAAGHAGTILEGYPQPTPQPVLSISQTAGGNVVVSWPENIAGWSLQQAATLQSDSWKLVPAPGNTVTLTSKLGGEFFRLYPNLP